MEIDRFVWTEHARMRLGRRGLDVADVEQFEAIYDHPHGDDEAAVRIVSVWRLDSRPMGGATL